MKTAVLKVNGMTCGHCVRAVGSALGELDGVESADVDLDTGRATVRYDEAAVQPERMVAAVIEEGYTAEEATS